MRSLSANKLDIASAIVKAAPFSGGPGNPIRPMRDFAGY
jgi:hypothetical protein